MARYNGYTIRCIHFYFRVIFLKLKTFCKDLLVFIIGGIIYSVAVLVFLAPNEIAPGGVTGIATILNFLFSLPIGVVVLIINIPLLILGFLKFGKGFIFKTTIATVCTSLILDIGEVLLPKFHIDLILASVFGGSLIGFGISLIMLRGSTTGGVDIIAKLINRRFPHISVGKIMLLIDAVVVMFAAFVYKNAQSALYSVVALYSSSRIMDLVLYGSDKGKIVYVISDKTQYIVDDILLQVNRGVTVIDVVGGYKGEKRKMIMCTVRRNEVSAVYNSVRRYDEGAFIGVAEAGEILGEGFKK